MDRHSIGLFVLCLSLSFEQCALIIIHSLKNESKNHVTPVVHKRDEHTQSQQQLIFYVNEDTTKAKDGYHSCHILSR